MSHSDEYRCPNCDSTDLANIHLSLIDDELFQCQSCQRLCRVKYDPDGTLRLIQV